MTNRNVFIAGAGISLDSPANFPIANHIIKKIIQLISHNYKIRNELLSFNRGDSNIKLKGDYIRFEMLMDVISGIDEKLDILQFVKYYQEPNHNHYCLAQAAINGDYVITPNFDDLIERAIEHLGYDPISVCFDKDFKYFDGNLVNKRVPVYKIHGSYYKYLGNGNVKRISKNTMQASLSKISSGNDLFALSSNKCKCIETLIKDSEELIVVGYSGCDDFDIIPSLMKINPPNIVWIQHSDEVDYSNKIYRLIEKNEKEKVDAITDRDNFILTQHQNGALKYCETITSDFFCEYIKKSKIELNKKEYKKVKNNHFDKNIAIWSRKFITPEIKTFLSAELFYHLSEYEKSFNLYNTIQPNSALYLKSRLASIGSMLKRNRFDIAQQLLNDLSNYISEDNKEEYCIFLEKKAYCKSQISDNNRDVDAIEKLFNDAISTCIKYKQHKILSTCHNDYALFLRDIGEIKKAKQQYTFSMNTAKRIGSLRQQSWVKFNLACIHFDQGQYKKSLKLNLESKEIASRIGDFQHICNIENLNGVNYLLLGDILNSIKSIRKSIYLERIQNNENNSAVDWLTLGQVFFETNRNKMALYCYTKSFNLFLLNDDKTYFYELLFCRYILYLQIENIPNAINDYNQLKQLNSKRENLFVNIIEEIGSLNRSNLSRLLSEILSMNEKTLFLNTVYQLVLLKIPPKHIGENHLNYSIQVYKNIGNSKRNTTIKKHLLTD